MTVEEAVLASRCEVAWRFSVHTRGVEFAGPAENPMLVASLAGFATREPYARDVSLAYAVRYEDWEPCLPKTAIDRLGELADPTT